VENCCIWYYSTAAFPTLKLCGGKLLLSSPVELAVSDSELYLDNEPEFLQRVEKNRSAL
jgi:hypothetical protein